MYPILWAIEHAPIVDAEERAILVALVTKGDFDGCNCYRSFPTLARVARVDERTAMRKVKAMTERGLLRLQKGPKPKSWLKLPRGKRPVVREVMVPASFWSAVQLEEINAQRADRGREPITAENRPDLGDAPPKRVRADKGKPNPKRSRKKKVEPSPEEAQRGDYKTPLEETPEEQGGVTTSHPKGCLEVTSRGDYKSPNPLLSPSASPSSSPTPPPVEESPQAPDAEPPAEEEEEGTPAAATKPSGSPSVDLVLSLTDATAEEAAALVELIRPKVKHSLVGLIRTMAERDDLGQQLWLLRRQRASEARAAASQAAGPDKVCEKHKEPLDCPLCEVVQAVIAKELLRQYGPVRRPDLARRFGVPVGASA